MIKIKGNRITKNGKNLNVVKMYKGKHLYIDHVQQKEGKKGTRAITLKGHSSANEFLQNLHKLESIWCIIYLSAPGQVKREKQWIWKTPT